MRIAFFEASPHWSGGAKRIYLLAKNLLTMGHQPVVCCLAGSLLSHKFSSLGGEVEIITPNFDPDIFAFLRIIKIIKKHKITLLDLCSPKFYWIGCFAGILLKKKVIITRTVPFRKKGLKKLINRFLYNNLADIVIAVSENVRRDLIKDFSLSEDKVKTITFGIDLKEFSVYEKTNILEKEYGIRGNPIIGIVTRLDENKGLENLIFSVPLVVKEFPDVKFIIAGTGKKLKELLELVEKLNLKNYVFFIGFREDIPKILTEVDITMIPSPKEALPTIAMESMAVGKPVVSVDSGGIRELIQDGYNGVICSSFSSESIADGIIKLLKSDYKKIGSAARETIEKKFTIDVSVSRYISVCNELLDENKI
ncbi:MAG: glycosyltransferase family 4 protein [Endomicrobiia bacterium]